MRTVIEIATILKKYKEDNNLTTRQFADYLGVHHATLGKWMRNERTPSKASVMYLLSMVEK